jgi:ADP-heptose:LPS heptosyltransferase
LHTKGNTGQERKSLPDAIAAEFYKSLLDRFDGSIVLLDWDNRVPRLASYRVRHLDELGPCSIDVMLALMARSDLVIGVDSGPLHPTVTAASASCSKKSPGGSRLKKGRLKKGMQLF